MFMVVKKAIYPRDWELPDFEVIELYPKKTIYCICIPVINEGRRIRQQLVDMRKYATLADIIILDGDSQDHSLDLRFLKKNGVRALLIKKSYGKQAAQLRMGFAYAIKLGYKGIVTIDGNHKDGVERIPDFVKALKDGYDFVQGSRFERGGKAVNTPWLRYFGNRLILSPMFSLAAKKYFSDVTNGFRCYSAKFLLDPQVKPFRQIFVTYDLLFYLLIKAGQLGFKVKQIPVVRRYPEGKVPTKITGFKGIWNLFKTGVFAALGNYNP